jgi:hypothetical protein
VYHGEIMHAPLFLFLGLQTVPGLWAGDGGKQCVCTVLFHGYISRFGRITTVHLQIHRVASIQEYPLQVNSCGKDIELFYLTHTSIWLTLCYHLDRLRQYICQDVVGRDCSMSCISNHSPHPARAPQHAFIESNPFVIP